MYSSKIRAFFAILFLAALFITTAMPTSATHLPYVRRKVCNTDPPYYSLYVRAEYHIIIGTLYEGQTFDRTGPGPYSYTVQGWAWGGVHKHGHVLGQYLCNP